MGLFGQIVGTMGGKVLKNKEQWIFSENVSIIKRNWKLYK